MSTLDDLLAGQEEWRRGLSERLSREGSPAVNDLVEAKRREEAEALVKEEVAREHESRIEAAVERLRKSEEDNKE